jgi:hypothetical protein
MRNPPVGADYRFFLHLIANSDDGGIRDLAGNAIDLQGVDAELSNNVVIPFTVDTRMNGTVPFFENNLAVSIVRRFASRDEDSQPSYFLNTEVQPPGAAALSTAPILSRTWWGRSCISMASCRLDRRRGFVPLPTT